MITINQFKNWPLFAAVIPIASAILCAMMIVALHPLLTRYALARPNARSSHTIPTPQGGGIAVITATVMIVMLTGVISGLFVEMSAIVIVLIATVFLALVGAIDDLRPIPVFPRLALQIAAIIAILIALPADLHIVPFIPAWTERALLLVAILWFVNLVNFMDGLDWMTIAEMLPVTIALAALGFAGVVPSDVLLVTLALAGSLIGFAPFNRPVARLFLGDVGSLPLGLLIAWSLVLLAGQGHLVAALLLPLYYLTDATLTLLLRLHRGEKIWHAHRSHFYQRATDNGYRIIQIVREVFVLNIILAALAASSIALTSAKIDVILLMVGEIAVAIILIRFSRPKRLSSAG